MSSPSPGFFTIASPSPGFMNRPGSSPRFFTVKVMNHSVLSPGSLSLPLHHESLRPVLCHCGVMNRPVLRLGSDRPGSLSLRSGSMPLRRHESSGSSPGFGLPGFFTVKVMNRSVLRPGSLSLPLHHESPEFFIFTVAS
ncbi:hypothetical protein AMTR_s00002p00270320 [Amborella trichopoda]|uniref:Uncharacterized protein n=1 Tax=Amborella trichopoda TaxID=13333 RepID=W1NV39_AMBTC|nr:hypothetical protein AMTR_s00002p00270320 [Amborella trichopoda]